MVKRILSIATWIITGVGILFLMAFARQQYRHSTIKRMDLQIDRKSNVGFLQHEKIMNSIMRASDSAVGKPVSTLKPSKLQAMLDANPWIDHSDVSTSINGIVNIRLRERNAVLRVYNSLNQSVYVDQNGTLFPENPDYSSRVLIANGYIKFPALTATSTASIYDSAYRITFLPQLYKLSQVLENDIFLNALIDQIYINSLGDIELSPKMGAATIILGDLADLDQKLSKLKTFYKTKAGTEELQSYQSVNLKYKNQIVCTKR